MNLHSTPPKPPHAPFTEALAHVFPGAAGPIADFRFDAQLAETFDAMAARSVPLYQEMQRMACEIANDFAVPATDIYDLGCATGTTLLALDKIISPYVGLVGIDNSPHMLARAHGKLGQAGLGRSWRLEEADLHGNVPITNASVVTLLQSLQFVRPLYRARLMANIYQGLNPGGCVILMERHVVEDSRINRLFIDGYHRFKRRNGYSETEIAQKREALENVLLPYRFEENRALFETAGFRAVEECFRWYNFTGILAIK